MTEIFLYFEGRHHEYDKYTIRRSDVLESGFCKFHDENYFQDENNHKEFVDRPTSKVIRGALVIFLLHSI